MELQPVLNNIEEWEGVTVTRDSNRVAFLIAASVTKENRLQSYVAQGNPSWLRNLIAEETTRSAVG